MALFENIIHLGKKISGQSFNGIIGGKNGTYNLKPSDYKSVKDYIDKWLLNHNKKFEDEKNSQYEKSVHRIHKLLEDEFLKEYIIFFYLGVITERYYKTY